MLVHGRVLLNVQRIVYLCFSQKYPLVIEHNYGKLLFIVDLPINSMVMFHGYVNVYQAGYVQKSKDTVAGHILNMGVSIHGGTPYYCWMVYFHGKKPENKMDDGWGYPHFRKPPYTYRLRSSVLIW